MTKTKTQTDEIGKTQDSIHKDQSETTSALARLSNTPDNKAPGAFRTIREVADILGVQQHVLRFWETKFNQVKPLKRGGGRRYYRPEDVVLLQHIHHLLYTQGYTIKGVQKLFKGNTKNQIVSDIANGTDATQQSVSSASAEQTDTASVKPSQVSQQSRLSQKQRSILEAMLGELKEVRSIIKS